MTTCPGAPSAMRGEGRACSADRSPRPGPEGALPDRWAGGSSPEVRCLSRNPTPSPPSAATTASAITVCCVVSLTRKGSRWISSSDRLRSDTLRRLGGGGDGVGVNDGGSLKDGGSSLTYSRRATGLGIVESGTGLGIVGSG